MLEGALKIGLPELAALMLATAIVGAYVSRLLNKSSIQTDLQETENVARSETSDYIDILSKLTHHVRSPIEIVIGTGSKMGSDSKKEGLKAKNKFDIEQYETYLEDVRKDANTVTERGRAIKKVMDGASKLARGRDTKSAASMKEDFEELSMRDIVSRAVNGNEIKHEIKIDMDLPESELRVKGDRGFLAEVMDNLLENAVKYSGREKEIAVTLKYNQKDDTVVCAVKDNGLGVPSEDQPKIFQEGIRLEESHEDGSGLGLAIVKQYVELHGGQVKVNSTYGEGSTFTFSLPCVK
jgi:signal transduction histidine kinase